MIVTAKPCIEQVSNPDERAKLVQYRDESGLSGYAADMFAVQQYHADLFKDVNDVRELAGMRRVDQKAYTPRTDLLRKAADRGEEDRARAAVDLMAAPKTPRAKDLTGVARNLREAFKPIIDKPINELSDAEFKQQIRAPLERELDHEESANPDYKSFYTTDITEEANKELQRYAQEKYGRTLSPQEVDFYHLLSAFGSPENTPNADSNMGFQLFKQYLDGQDISTKTTKHGTNYGWVEGKKDKVDLGTLRFTDSGDPYITKISKTYQEANLAVVKRLIDRMGVDGAMDWLHAKHPVSEIEKVLGKTANRNEYIAPGKEVPGIFGLTGAKLASYWQNRTGHLDTVTKDLWYARTMARYFGEPLTQTVKGKTGPLKLPWKEGAEERYRRLADEVFAEVGAERGISPAHVQERIWNFEKRLWEHLGSPAEDASYVSDGLRAGIDASEQSKGPRRFAATVGAAPLREGTIRDLGLAKRAFNSTPYRDFVDLHNKIAKSLGLKTHEVINSVGAYEDTSANFEASLLPSMTGTPEDIQTYAALMGVLGRDIQHSVATVRYVAGGPDVEHRIQFKTKEAAQDFVKFRNEVGINDLSYDPATNSVILLDRGRTLNLEPLFTKYGKDIESGKQRNADIQFIPAEDYGRIVQGARDSLQGRDAGVRGKNLSTLLDAAESKLAKAGLSAEDLAPKTGEPLKMAVNGDHPAFYSALERSIEQKMPSNASAEQVKGIIKDAKQEERDWLGIDQYLDEHPKVSKDELLNFIRENQAKVEEVVKSDSGSIPLEWKPNKYGEIEGGDGASNFSIEPLDSGEFQLTVSTSDNGTAHVVDTFPSVGEAKAKAQSIVDKEDVNNPTKFSQYTLPGGENYKELLLTMPTQGKPSFETWLKNKYGDTSDLSEGTIDTARRMWEQDPFGNAQKFGDNVFKSPHFSEPNILAHIRFDDRTVDGKKVLHISEIQSDWHQAGRKKGYNVKNLKVVQNPNRGTFDIVDVANGQRQASYPTRAEAEDIANRSGGNIPNAPFKKSWNELAFKKALRYATENGYDAISWDTGDTQFGRWGSERVDWKELPGSRSDAFKARLKAGVPSVSKGRWVGLRDFGSFDKSAIEKEGADNIIARMADRWGVKPSDIEIVESGRKFTVSAKEQEGGNAGGVNIEDEARRRGELLEADGEPVHSQADLEKILQKVLSRENTPAEITQRAEKLWKKMLEEREGTHLPRKEGMEGFYDKILPNFANKYTKKWGGRVEAGDIKDNTYAGAFGVYRNGELKLSVGSATDAQKYVNRYPPIDRSEFEIRQHKATETPVHRLDITPQMKESVMQGQPLFARDQKLQNQMNRAPIEKVVKAVNPEDIYRERNGDLRLSIPAAEMFERVRADWNKSQGFTSDTTPFSGIAFSSNDGIALEKHYNDVMRPELEKTHSDEELEGTDALMSMVGDTAEANKKFSVKDGHDWSLALVDPDARKHEITHVEERRLGGLSPEFVKATLTHEFSDALNNSKEFQRDYPGINDKNRASEILAILASNDDATAKRYGLDKVDDFESKKQKFLEGAYDDLLDQNLDTIKKMGPDAFAENFGTVAAWKPQEGATETNAENNTSVEATSNVDEGGTEHSGGAETGDEAAGNGGLATKPEVSAGQPVADANGSAGERPKTEQPGGGEDVGELRRSPTSTKNEIVDEEREKRGLPPIMKSAEKDFGTVWDRAMKTLDQNDEASSQLVTDLLNHPNRVPNDEENALLLHYKIVKHNEYEKAAQAVVDAMKTGDPTEIAIARRRIAPLQDTLERIDQVTTAAGTAAGRGLNARKMMANEDMSLANLVTRTIASYRKGNKPLTDADIAEMHVKLADVAQKYKDAVAKNERYEKELANRQVENALTEGKPNERLMAAAQKIVQGLNTKAVAARALLKDAGVFDPGRGLLKSVALQGRAQTETPEFKIFFKDSKVVDENGNPLIMWHHGPAGIEVFRSSEIGPHFGTQEQATRRAIARPVTNYITGRKGEHYQAYLSIQNPLRVEDYTSFTKLKRSLPEEAQNARGWSDARRILADLGYDGLVYANQVEGKGDTYVPFEPNQIKSATGNNGNFDPNEASILKMAAPLPPPQLDPKIMKALAEVGASHIAETGIDRNAWDDAMKGEFGDKIVPRLDALWDSSNKAFDNIDVNVRGAIVRKADTVENLTEKIKNKLDGGADADVSSLVNRLAKQFIAEGVKDRNDLVNKLHGVLSEIDPSITKTETVDALTGYGRFTPLSTDDVNVQLRDLKGQLRQVRKLEDMAEGLAPKASGYEHPTPTDEERRLIKQVEEEKKKGGYVSTNPEAELKSKQASIKTRLENQIRDLQDEIDTKTLVVKLKNKTQDTKEIVELRKKLAEKKALHEEIFGKRGSGPRTDEQRLAAWKTRTQNRINELSAKVAEEDFTKAPKRGPVPLDAQGLALKADIERIKTEFARGLKSNELQNRTTGEKLWDFWTRYRRGSLLSGPSTIEKLTAAALARVVTTPIEQVIEHGWGKMLPGISNKMSRQYGFRTMAEARAITDMVTKGMGDFWQNLKFQESDLEKVYGKQHLAPKYMMEYFGSIHGALKAPVKRAAFTRYYTLAMAKIIHEGVIDPENPVVMAQVGIEAYKAANRAIFMQDNFMSDWWTGGIRRLEMPKAGKDHPTSGAKAFAGVLKTLLPIVKIPTNFVGETVKYTVGLPVGLGKAVNAYRHGTENLSPEDADLIMRWLKKGSLGAAAMAIGALNPQAFGGYYQGKRDEKDVPVGGIRLYGHDIPRVLLHNPFFEAMQIGATFRRAAAEFLRHDKDGVDAADAGKSAAIGLLAASVGLVSEVPFVKESEDIGKLLDPKTRGKFIEEQIKSMVVPQGISQLADKLDQPKGSPWTNYLPLMGDTVKRKPSGLFETLATGVPYWRQNVPEAKESNLDETKVSPAALAAQEKRAKLGRLMDLIDAGTKEGKDVEKFKTDLVAKADIAMQTGKLTDAEAQRLNQVLGTDKYQPTVEGEPEVKFPKHNEDAKGVIDRIVGWAKGLAMDPVDAFDKLAKFETFKRLENGTIIVERMPDKDDPNSSGAERARRGGGGEAVKLDHVVSLELGGTNEQSNLRLVTKEEWESYTPVENYLGGALHDGRINGREAAALITGFKNGTLTAEDIEKKVGLPMEASPASSAPPAVAKELQQFDIPAPKVGTRLTLEKNGQPRYLSPAEKRAYQEAMRTQVYGQLEQIIASPEYQQMSDEDKERMLRRAAARARTRSTRTEKSTLRGSVPIPPP